MRLSDERTLAQPIATVRSVAFPKRMRLSHDGAKNSSSKDGWWGFRDEAKRYAKKAARLAKRKDIRDELDHT